MNVVKNSSLADPDKLKLDFYLSEMSVSDQHGGGITLQRLLGADLALIKRFIHPGRFSRDYPPIASVRGRSDYVVTWFEEDSARFWLGRMLSDWCYQKLVEPELHARQTAEIIDHRFPGKRSLCLLVCPQSAVSIVALEFLKKRRQLQYISWVMDDHIVRYYNGGWEYPKTIRAIIGKHLREANSVFVISPTMADFYYREFNVRSEVLFGPAVRQCEPVRIADSTSGPLAIGYFGSVGPWQIDALVRFAATLPPEAARLHIFTNDVLPSALQLPAVEFKGGLAKEAVLEKMREYDGVLLPISFAGSQRHLSEFNIATKMSECLTSGTITLVYGPAYAAMVRFLQTTGAACILTDESLADWPCLVKKLKDSSYRCQVLEAARTLVQQELSISIMRKRWLSAMNKLSKARYECAT